MSEISIELSSFIDDFISKHGNDVDKKIWEKKGKKWFMVFIDSKISKVKESKSTTQKKATPKRAMTPYNLYVKEQFPIIQKESPTLSPQNVMKEIAKKWKKNKKNDEPAEEVDDNSIAKNHTFFVFELFNSLFNVK